MDLQLPKIVVTTLDQWLDDGLALQDYKILGNLKYSSIILRFCPTSMLAEIAMRSPCHKSPAKHTRDDHRLNTWSKNNSTPTHISDTVCNFDGLKLSTPILANDSGVCSDFTLQSANAAPVHKHRSAQTDAPVIVDLASKEIQTGVNNITQKDAHTQSSTQDIKKKQKHKRIQTVKPKLCEKGIACIPNSSLCGTQTDVSCSKEDKDTLCLQSPGAINRHSQTFRIKHCDKAVQME